MGNLGGGGGGMLACNTLPFQAACERLCMQARARSENGCGWMKASPCDPCIFSICVSTFFGDQVRITCLRKHVFIGLGFLVGPASFLHSLPCARSQA